MDEKGPIKVIKTPNILKGVHTGYHASDVVALSDEVELNWIPLTFEKFHSCTLWYTV